MTDGIKKTLTQIILAFGRCTINNDFHKRNLEKLNKALGTSFTKENMEIIYQYFGNGLNQDLTASFVVSGYDMNIFKEVQNEKSSI